MGQDEHHLAQHIGAQLQVAAGIRVQQCRTAGLSDKVAVLKRYQQLRFQRTYADLLSSPRFGPAAHFFLEELYGPGDFSRRDAQFSRVVPAMVRLFPGSVVAAIRTLVELHALSESLDDAMARQLGTEPLDAAGYVRAWRSMDQGGSRQDQLRLAIDVGRRLDELTRSRILRQSLHWMRGPASAAGLGDLQHFLEQGFDTFASMKGAADFLAVIRDRESRFLDAMAQANQPNFNPERFQVLLDLP